MRDTQHGSHPNLRQREPDGRIVPTLPDVWDKGASTKRCARREKKSHNYTYTYMIGASHTASQNGFRRNFLSHSWSVCVCVFFVTYKYTYTPGIYIVCLCVRTYHADAQRFDEDRQGHAPRHADQQPAEGLPRYVCLVHQVSCPRVVRRHGENLHKRY